MQNDHGAADDREYVIQIYHRPAEIGFPIPGRERFLKETAFLEELTGWRSSSPRRYVPASVDGYYVLDDEQFDQYLSFRKKLSTGG